MKKTEGNRMTVYQENKIIRQCNHVKASVQLPSTWTQGAGAPI